MKRILIVEDDAALRENTAKLLALENFEVITAANCSEGIRLARESNPDIIICDILMPEKDGFNVLKEFSSNDHTRHIPFIFLSAKTNHKEIRLGMDFGADDYIIKPFDEEELLSAIKSRMAKVHILNNIISLPQHEPYKNIEDLKKYFDDHGDFSHHLKGETIYKEGDRANKIFLILKGLVKTHKMDQNGKKLITSIQKPEDFMGLTSFIDNNPYQESATVVEDRDLAGVNKQILKELLSENCDLSLELMNILTDNLSDIKDHLLQMAYSSVSKKTAQTILQFAEVLDKGPLGEIKISRSDLASVAGIAPESLIRTLSDFKKKGIIEIEGRNIKILKLNELQNLE
ncbi:response regulator [Gillisia sp. CAL575]|uniref:response regulator n=1 Tax=Gillisia sp. CAL575 TaxID=985255 RepID=UPI00039AD1DD|nr:response regulator [Gillisia sp. CAL575]